MGCCNNRYRRNDDYLGGRDDRSDRGFVNWGGCRRNECRPRPCRGFCPRTGRNLSRYR